MNPGNINTRKILIIDDEASVRKSLAVLLGNAGYQVETAETGEVALEVMKEASFDLFLIDLQFPGTSGIDILQNIRKEKPEADCVVLTGYGSIEASVEAMKAGATDFITKPFEVNRVLGMIENILAQPKGKRETAAAPASSPTPLSPKVMVYQSEKMEKVMDLLEKVSESDSTILIQGESGTGKEVVAKSIHEKSSRRNKPFIPINCGAIPESLLESELFGHEKGAFTGATNSRLGRFELANGGTIFLDEINELPLPMQVKLLRVLQERSFERVGGVRPVRVDIRILAATNQDLELAVHEKRFRKDLFYRINVIPIDLPPLRDRKEDISLLADHFLQRFNQRRGKKVAAISEDVLKRLLAYDWPGNIRELENLIERLITLAQEETITVDDLPEKLLNPQPSRLLSHIELPEDGLDFAGVVSEFENQLLRQALSKAQGVKNRAAQILKLNRTTLVEKLKKKGLSSI